MTAEALSRAQDELEEAIGELRELARGIHPTLLREEGLEAAVAALARRTPLPITVGGSAGDRLPDAVELAAYFLVSEAITNVVKHANASSVRNPPGARCDDATRRGGGRRRRRGAHRRRLRARGPSRPVGGARRDDWSYRASPGRGTTVQAEIPCGS